ncbi:MAG: dockerin type I domain-containing protein [Phycisphaerales bacterium]
MRPIASLIVPAVTGLMLASPSLATGYRFEIDSKGSSVSIDLGLGVPIAGSLIGDYDATTNPGGTRTLPGFFGGSGNQPIPYSADLDIEGTILAAPQGTFDMVWATDAPTAAIEALSIDLLGGTPGELDATFTLLFSTFRTFNPDSLFPGGIPIPVPLGTASVESLTLSQSGAATIAILPVKGGGWTFAGLVPVDLYATISQGDQVFVTGPTPAELPLAGSLASTPLGLVMSLALDGSQSFDEPFTQEFPAQIVELPTVIPSGNIATVIFSGTVDGVSGTAAFAGSIDAFGAIDSVPGDLNGDGIVNGADLAILLGSWGDGGVPADLNGDGIVNGADLSILLGEWGANK